MSAPEYLAEWRADQRDDLALASDHALFAFLAEVQVDMVVQERLPRAEIEQRHLTSISRRTA